MVAHPTFHLSIYYVGIIFITCGIYFRIGVTTITGTSASPKTTCSTDPEQPHCVDPDPALIGENTGANDSRSKDIQSERHTANESSARKKSERENRIQPRPSLPP